MKKRLLIVIALFSLLGFVPNNNAQTGFNTVVEYCTGTWCQWCPCGHTIINDILINYPNTMVLSYHGAGSDPWLAYSLPMIQMFGFNAYPTGVVGRRTGIISRGSWNNQVVIQSGTIQPGVSIAFNNYAYNVGSRTITADVVVTASTNLSGNYFLNLIITEDNMVYPQTGNGSCPGGSNYIHKHVVKGLINGATGQALNSGGSWTQGVPYTIALNYAIPSGFVENNCKINALVYKQGSSHVSTDYDVQQTKITPATGVTGIVNQNEIAAEYSLGQNYPNPFNPTTNIKFSIPKSGHATLKFYDAIGNEIATYLDEIVEAGVYNAEFDGSNLASGIYFYTLKAGNFAETKKMSLVK
jgi:hypothetical protein